MDPAVLRKLEALASVRIDLVPIAGLDRHFVFARDGYASLVERRTDGAGQIAFGQIGAAGLVTESGFAALVWREGRGIFLGKGIEAPASEEQVAGLRAFAADLERALR